MGSSASKTARKATSARQYPTRIPRTTPTLSEHVANRAVRGSGITEASQAEPYGLPKTSASTPDQSDLALGSRLRSIGPVRPSPHPSDNSQSDMNTRPDAAANALSPHFRVSEANPALAVLSARQQFQDAADAEFNAIGRKGFQGRKLLDAGTIRQALVLRDERGMTGPEIERLLGAKSGVLSTLGAKGVVSAAATHGEGFGERGG